MKKYIISASLFCGYFSLVLYQIIIWGNVPIQDEWGYLYRIISYADKSYESFLFDRYQVYFIPSMLFIWDLWYRLFNLDLISLRITGATVQLVCIFCMLRLFNINARAPIIIILSIVLSGFSLNYWATYNQAIESIIEPFLQLLVVLSIFFAIDYDKNRVYRYAIVTILVCVATGFYAPALCVFPAVSIGMYFKESKVNLDSIIYFLIALISFASYYLFGGAGSSHINYDDLDLNLVYNTISLFGNSIITKPMPASITFIVGCIGLSYFAYCLVVSRDLFTNQQRAIIGSVFGYLLMVASLIVWRRNDPNFGFVPRYSIHFYLFPILILILISYTWSFQKLKYVNIFMLALLIVSIISVDCRIAYQSQFFEKRFVDIRKELDTISGPINIRQQELLIVGDPLRDYVYPGIEFARANGLFGLGK